MKAIILAGGRGERLKPLTDEMPKPLLPIKGKPIIQHAIENLKRHGVTEIILSVGYRHEMIQAHLGDGKGLGVDIAYCIEESPLGTGGGIKLAAKGIDETFLVLNGDNLADYNIKEIIEFHRMNNAAITLALCPVEDVTKYGIADLMGKKIIRFIEKPAREDAPSNLNNAGFYVMEPYALEILPEGKSSIEYDCFEVMCGMDGKVFGYEHKGQWFPTDSIELYNKAEKEFMPPA